MGNHEPLLMLGNHANDYGTRWTLGGQQVEPAIARYLMNEGYVENSGTTEFGAKELRLTDAGVEFRSAGIAWWKTLGLFEKMKIALWG
jgi:hypothetical protein